MAPDEPISGEVVPAPGAEPMRLGVTAGTDDGSALIPKSPRDARAELEAMGTALSALEPLPAEAQQRALEWLASTLEIDLMTRAGNQSTLVNPGQTTEANQVAEVETPPTPRVFMSEKKPRSAVERVACLAYYLTTYRGVQRFKTPDITELNTEAALPKFGNPRRDVDKADRQHGFVVAAGNGTKQITTRAEKFVEALPDREAAQAVLAEHEYRPKRYASGVKKSVQNEEDR